ncbi:MAG: Transcriptional regulator/antitoxin, MazE [Verrucomicrobiales bacterium]|nr:Transcriptional regulator/antitoxin, MazE [Verrucomicrobiales bacterium]
MIFILEWCTQATYALGVTTTMSERGQLVIPKAVRQRLSLRPGDDFNVEVEGDGTVRLQKISRDRKPGLGKHLLACPVELGLPARASKPLRAFRDK